MKTSAALLLALAVCLAGCDLRKSSPVAPSDVTPVPAEAVPPAGTAYPNNGPDVIAFVVRRYPERLKGGISRAQRIENMKFLRDRIIEAGKCGGMDLGWNLKRGGPEVSVDFITERRGGRVIGHDIAVDYDNPRHALQLYWGNGTHPFYKSYPAPSCQ